MIVNSIIHKIYLNIVSAIYKYWYKYICIHIYIYICICSLWFLLSHYTNFYIMICIYIYIYKNINSYIMILYTCCDIKHACIHWTFGESNMPWARGLAIGSTSSGINLMHLYYALSTMHCSKEFWHLIGEH